MSAVIGIVSCGYIDNRQFVTQPYIHAIEASGGVPILLPCTAKDTFFSRYASICDGFLFCGGNDITPWLFGEEPLTDRGSTDTGTDLFHLSFMKYVLSAKLPVLAICRGMQILNIAMGGTIYQDMELRTNSSLNHMQISESRYDVSHKVIFSSNSMLYNICGESIYTNSFHHQCLKSVSENLRITGITSDGVIESVESVAHPFAVGTQWHPECMFDTSPEMQALFSQFINNSKNAKIIHMV